MLEKICGLVVLPLTVSNKKNKEKTPLLLRVVSGRPATHSNPCCVPQQHLTSHVCTMCLAIAPCVVFAFPEFMSGAIEAGAECTRVWVGGGANRVLLGFLNFHFNNSQLLSFRFHFIKCFLASCLRHCKRFLKIGQRILTRVPRVPQFRQPPLFFFARRVSGFFLLIARSKHGSIPSFGFMNVGLTGAFLP